MPRGGSREGSGRKKIYSDDKERIKAKNERAKEKRKIMLEQARTIDKMRDLPVDIIKGIFSFMEVDQIIDCALVCKNWHALCKDQELWRTLCFKRWKFLELIQKKNWIDINWKRVALSYWRSELGSIREIRQLTEELVEDPNNIQLEEKFLMQLNHYKTWRKMRIDDPIATSRRYCDFPNDLDKIVEFLFRGVIYTALEESKKDFHVHVANGSMISLQGVPIHFCGEFKKSHNQTESLSLAFTLGGEDDELYDWIEIIAEDNSDSLEALDNLKKQLGMQDAPLTCQHLFIILVLIWFGDRNCDFVFERYPPLGVVGTNEIRNKERYA